MLKSRRCDIGRYYSGDINGKFWFGVQDSTTADRFGVTHSEPNYVDYLFDQEDLPRVEKELTSIENIIGSGNLQKLNNFWNTLEGGYNDKILEEHGMLYIWNKHKTDYADYLLGCKIRDYLKEHEYCEFTAEL